MRMRAPPVCQYNRTSSLVVSLSPSNTCTVAQRTQDTTSFASLMDPGSAARPEEFRGPPSVRAVATVLAVLGCGAAVLALFAMTLETAEFPALGNCSPAVAEAAEMRAGAALLLLSAASQALAAAWARCVLSRVLTLLASWFPAITVYRVPFVVPAVVIAAAGRPSCHGQGFQHAFAIHYLLLLVLLCVPLLGAVVTAFIGDY